MIKSQEELQKLIKQSLEYLREFSYDDGAILWDANFCNEQEKEDLSVGTLEMLSRMLARDIYIHMFDYNSVYMSMEAFEDIKNWPDRDKK